MKEARFGSKPLGGIWDGIKTAQPIMFGYLGLGMAAGLIAAQAGLSALEILLLSLIVFAGSAQFVFAQLWTAGGLILLPTIFFLNFRHFLYSASFSPLARHLPFASRFAIGAQLTDETFSLAATLLRGRALHSASWMLALNLASYTAWACGNLTGALLGDYLSGMEQLGLDFALPAMYVAILMLLLTGDQTVLRPTLTVIAIAGGAILLLEWLYPHPVNILIASVLAASLGVVFFRPSKQQMT